MRTVLRVLPLLLLACGVAGAYNVFADEPQLEAQARARACEQQAGAACKARLERLERTPFRQRYVFNRGGSRAQVDCQRSFIFAGDYDCGHPVVASP